MNRSVCTAVHDQPWAISSHPHDITYTHCQWLAASFPLSGHSMCKISCHKSPAKELRKFHLFIILFLHATVIVRVSVTLCSPIKTVQARITKSSLQAAPRTLVFCDKLLFRWVRGFPSKEGMKERYALKVFISPLFAHLAWQVIVYNVQ